MAETDRFPFAFGMNQFTTQPWSFEEDVERYIRLGVEAIEVCEAKLDEGRWAEQMASAVDSGLAISAVQPLVRTFGASQMQREPKGVEPRVARLRQSIERLAPRTPGAPFVVNTGAPEDGDVAGMVEITISELRALAPFAAGHGVTLEPLSATSMNAETAIWIVGQALDILDTVDSSNVGLCLDLWNVWQDAGLGDEIRRAGGRILVLQVSDWRMPRSGGDRLVPGNGAIPLGPLLRLVGETGFEGACTVETFSKAVPDSLYDRDLSEVIRASRAGLETAWNEARRVGPDGSPLFRRGDVVVTGPDQVAGS